MVGGRAQPLHSALCVCVCACTCTHAHVCTLSCPALCDPVDYIACQVPLSMEFSRQKYWSGLPFPSPEDLPDPGIEPTVSCISCVD